jgi:hypothetical protein
MKTLFAFLWFVIYLIIAGGSDSHSVAWFAAGCHSVPTLRLDRGLGLATGRATQQRRLCLEQQRRLGLATGRATQQRRLCLEQQRRRLYLELICADSSRHDTTEKNDKRTPTALLLLELLIGQSYPEDLVAIELLLLSVSNFQTAMNLRSHEA